MKFISNYIFRSLCSLSVGLLILFNAEQMPSIIIQIIGILFLLPGTFGVLTYLYSKISRSSIFRPSFPLMSIGSILFGVYLELYPNNFVTYLVLLMGVLMMLAGISQILSMFTNRNVSPFSIILFLIPVVLVVVGGYCITHSKDAAETLFQILGGTCIYYGLSDMFLTLRAKHYSSVYEREQKKAEEAARKAREAEYVEFEIVNANENQA